MSANIGFINGVFNSKMEKPGGHRLGISYAASLFSVIGERFAVILARWLTTAAVMVLISN